MNVRRRQYVTAADAAKLLGKSDRTIRRWIDEGRIKARHAAHNRYEIALDDLEVLVEQQEGKEYVNPIERLRTLEQELAALKLEVEALKAQMRELTGQAAPERTT